MSKNKYKVYGITLESELELSELVIENKRPPDVWIKYGHIPKNIPNPKSKGLLYEAAEGDFILHIDTICSYRVQHGKRITILPKSEANIKDIKVFLYGPVLAALLHQKSIFPIHGSAVIFDNQATVISGVSSAGKSSLAYGLLNKGYSILSDDISVVTQFANQKFLVHPGIPYLKVWQDVVESYSQNEKIDRVRNSINKYLAPIGNKFSDEPIELKQIIVLQPTNEKLFKLRQVHGSQKFESLQNHTYRFNFLLGLGKIDAHFSFLSNLLDNVNVFLLERPIKPLQVKELTNFVEKHLIKTTLKK